MEDLGSDHCPIMININFKPSTYSFKRRKRWIFGNAESWRRWSGELPEVPNHIPSLSQSYDNLLNNIISTSNNIFKTTKEEVKPKFSKCWWDKDCELAVKDRRHKKNIFHKHPSVDNLIELRKAEALVKRITKKKQRKS